MMDKMLETRAIKCLAWYLVVAMFIIGITPRVYAGFSPSEALSTSPVERSSDMEKIRRVLEMKMVRERLRELGYTPEEIQHRLNALSDEQIHQLALHVDELQAGGDGLGIVIGLLVIAILVVILIYLLGHDIIIKKK
jgi:type VI protein secretion system component VasF